MHCLLHVTAFVSWNWDFFHARIAHYLRQFLSHPIGIKSMLALSVTCDVICLMKLGLLSRTHCSLPETNFVSSNWDKVHPCIVCYMWRILSHETGITLTYALLVTWDNSCLVQLGLSPLVLCLLHVTYFVSWNWDKVNARIARYLRNILPTHRYLKTRFQ